LQKPLLFARELVAGALKDGGHAVDATCGNGNDTLFLAGLVGESGRVLALDIQEQAIEKTGTLLRNSHVADRVTLVCACHADLAQYITGPLDAVMFNLGYLPRGDHRIITKPATTLAALQAALTALRKEGLVTLVIYTGHPGGKEEYNTVKEYVSSLPQQQYSVLEYKLINQVNSPPLLIAVTRL
jgi:tRNA1(Val) A37 N6-methylase TrmN6